MLNIYFAINFFYQIWIIIAGFSTKKQIHKKFYTKKLEFSTKNPDL